MARSVAAKLNVLESVIVRGEDSAEDARWGQAREVVRLLDAGHRQREIAAEWINGRTDKPYAQQHVSFCAQVWRRWSTSSLVDRPDWTTAYYTVQQRSDKIVEPEQRRQEWSEAHEARAPTTQGTAERFVENALAKGNPEVNARIAAGLLGDPDTRSAVVDDPQGVAAVEAMHTEVRGRKWGPVEAMPLEPLPPPPAFDVRFWNAVNAVQTATVELERWGVRGLEARPETRAAAERLAGQAAVLRDAVVDFVVSNITAVED